MVTNALTGMILIFLSLIPGFCFCDPASDKMWPRIYPLESELMPQTEVTPLICVYSVQTSPAPAPPNLASQTVVQCQPVKVVKGF